MNASIIHDGATIIEKKITSLYDKKKKNLTVRFLAESSPKTVDNILRAVFFIIFRKKKF